ncbi:MAG: hypothetical protein MJ051_04890 [Akkermansia sp.]|nr:hypothetical protein [Akkermansia sp.]
MTGALAALVAAFGLSSCGTPIPMQEMVPAKVCVPRNARVAISASGPGASEMQQATREVIGGDDYFTLAYGDADLGLNIRTDRTVTRKYFTDNKGKSQYYDEEKSYAGFSLVNYHNQSVITSTGLDYIGATFSERRCRNAAKEFYDIIHPHVVDYKVRVSIDEDENPNLMAAAQLCQAGKWEEAYAKVQESIAAVPNDPEAYFLKAMIEREDFKFDESDASLRQAIQMENKSKYTEAIQKNATLRVTQEQAAAQMSYAL